MNVCMYTYTVYITLLYRAKIFLELVVPSGIESRLAFVQQKKKKEIVIKKVNKRNLSAVHCFKRENKEPSLSQSEPCISSASYTIADHNVNLAYTHTHCTKTLRQKGTLNSSNNLLLLIVTPDHVVLTTEPPPILTPI